MIYLSRLDLNPASRQVRAELADPYQIHRTLSKAFGQGKEEYARARCLFRVEEPPGPGHPWLLVQSKIAPDWSKLSAAASYLSKPPVVKEYAPAFGVGQHLRFRLRANPTVKKAGKRQAILKEPDQVAWLKRKGEASGFEVMATETRSEEWLHSLTTGGCRADLSAVRFDGVLRVIDPATMIEGLESGIGSGKGFGFGLLSLARMK